MNATTEWEAICAHARGDADYARAPLETADATAADMLATLKEIAAFLTWNECATANPQIRMSKADISNALDHAILSARAAIAKAEGRL